MPRFPRSYIQTSFFHVITQGINKSYIFENAEDIKHYIKIMHKLIEELNIELIAYCIMNNHSHMLINTEKITELSKYMHRLNTSYAIYYNKKYSRVGYVFKNRYKSEGIYSEEHLYNCIKYIYDNPVKAGICKSAKEYPYSNYKEYNKEYHQDVKGNYTFIDVDTDVDKEQLSQKVIDEFLIDNLLKKQDLENDVCKLKELINILKIEHNISLRQISKALDINREKIRKIYKNNK